MCSSDLYLHPNPPAGSGTEFWAHNGSRRKLSGEDPAPNAEGWQQTDYIENVFNRLVLYRGNMYHKAGRYFGEKDRIETQRLTQTFFFGVRDGE